MFRLARFDEAGAIAFPHVGKQRKLRNGEDFAADIFDGTVHFALFVFKNAQVEDFVGQPRKLFLAILITHADQQHEARSDLLRFEGGVDGAQFVDNVNAGLAHSLHYYFHNPTLPRE